MESIPQVSLGTGAPQRPERARTGVAADRAGCTDRSGKRAARRRGARAARGETAPLVSLYDAVTARIVAQLEAGSFPWAQPWDAAAFAPGLPRNADTGRAYSGINILILWAEAARRGYPAQGWLTFRQARQAGGNVRKGEKGTTIFYGKTQASLRQSDAPSSRFTPKDEGGAGAPGREPPRGEDETEGARRVVFLKRFTVFNVAQVEGLPDRCTARDVPLPPRETMPQVEALIAASGADVRIGGNEAYYSPVGDYVALPPQQAFFEAVDYYRTALHELGHWTGHRSRLGRDQSGGFGSEAYGREELCAELTSAFLCAALGIRPTVRHADYVGAWLAILRADTRAIFRAASHASRAADYLLAFASAPAAQEAAA